MTDEHLERLEGKIDRVDTKVGDLDDRVDALERKLSKLLIRAVVVLVVAEPFLTRLISAAARAAGME